MIIQFGKHKFNFIDSDIKLFKDVMEQDLEPLIPEYLEKYLGKDISKASANEIKNTILLGMNKDLNQYGAKTQEQPANDKALEEDVEYIDGEEKFDPHKDYSKSRDDEIERTIEDEYSPYEEDFNSNEDEVVEDESNAYFEDMIDEQAEDIERAEEERQKAEEAKAEKAAKEKARAEKLRKENEYRERQRAEEERRRQEAERNVNSQQSTSEGTTTSTEQTSSQSPTEDTYAASSGSASSDPYKEDNGYTESENPTSDGYQASSGSTISSDNGFQSSTGYAGSGPIVNDGYQAPSGYATSTEPSNSGFQGSSGYAGSSDTVNNGYQSSSQPVTDGYKPSEPPKNDYVSSQGPVDDGYRSSTVIKDDYVTSTSSSNGTQNPINDGYKKDDYNPSDSYSSTQSIVNNPFVSTPPQTDNYQSSNNTTTSPSGTTASGGGSSYTVPDNGYKPSSEPVNDGYKPSNGGYDSYIGTETPVNSGYQPSPGHVISTESGYQASSGSTTSTDNSYKPSDSAIKHDDSYNASLEYAKRQAEEAHKQNELSNQAESHIHKESRVESTNPTSESKIYGIQDEKNNYSPIQPSNDGNIVTSGSSNDEIRTSQPIDGVPVTGGGAQSSLVSTNPSDNNHVVTQTNETITTENHKISSGGYDSNELRNTIETSDYSREHKKEVQEQIKEAQIQGNKVETVQKEKLIQNDFTQEQNKVFDGTANRNVFDPSNRHTTHIAVDGTKNDGFQAPAVQGPSALALIEAGHIVPETTSITVIRCTDVVAVTGIRQSNTAKQLGIDGPSRVICIGGPVSETFKSAVDNKAVNRARYGQMARGAGGKFLNGLKNAARDVIDEDDDINSMDNMLTTEAQIIRVATMRFPIGKRNKILNEMGVGRKAILQQLKEIEVVSGFGDTSNLSIKELKKLVATDDDSVPLGVKEQLKKILELRIQAKKSYSKIAEEVLQEGGEFRKYSIKKLEKLLANEKLDLSKRAQMEAAIKNHKLGKAQGRANGRWGSFKNLGTKALRKIFTNNEYIGPMVQIYDTMKTSWKVAKTAYKVGKKTVEVGAKAGKAVGSAVGKGSKALYNKAKNKFVQKKAAEVGARASNLIGQQGARLGAQVGTKFTTMVAQKTAVFASKAFALAKAGIHLATQAIAGLVQAIVGAISAIITACSGFLLFAMVLLAVVLIVVVIYTVICGDDQGMTVEEMVLYLEAKNDKWVTEIAKKADGTPWEKGKDGKWLKEYTDIYYTYYDAEGNVYTVTNNTKEIIAMASVHFEQDFSSEWKVKKYLDDLWSKSHLVSYTKGSLYGCNGTVCLKGSTARGYNAGSLTFNCTENHNTIAYDKCYRIISEHDWRVEVDKAGYRFTNATATADKYSGISDLKVSNSLTSYGCRDKTQTWTYYCSKISTYTNTEIQKLLVDAAGKDYSTLVAAGGCSTKHGTHIGKPATFCGDYTTTYTNYYINFTTLPKKGSYDFSWNYIRGRYEYKLKETGVVYYLDTTNLNMSKITVWYDSTLKSFRYTIPSYICKESSCNGHNITYHTCTGHTAAVCNGHMDYTINIQVLDIDEMYKLSVTNRNSAFAGWNSDNKDWVESILSQDWNDLYGITISRSLYDNVDGMGTSTMPSNSSSLPIPLYNQNDYTKTPFGKQGTVATHGCSVTCIAMLSSYYKDEVISPAMLGRAYGNYNTSAGASWTIFKDSASDLAIPFEKQTTSWNDVVAALKAGKPVVSIKGPGLFTSNGHFIILTGITSDGKILVNDPNGNNYSKSELQSGFTSGFTQDQIKQGSKGTYWIYGKK